jgi:hypothetical protein
VYHICEAIWEIRVYNAFHRWDVFSACDASGKFEVANIGTHEVGHTVGLDHLSDGGAYATMYPTASKGEERKQTLTDGDKSSWLMWFWG